MSEANGSSGAVESVAHLASVRPSGDPLVEALQDIVGELRGLRAEVASLKAKNTRDTTYLRDDVREVRERTNQIPIIKDMLVEVLTRIPD